MRLAPPSSPRNRPGRVATDELVRLERALTSLWKLRRAPLGAGRGPTVALEESAYGALSEIGEHGPIRLTDLAARLKVEMSTASRQVQRLCEAGLAEFDVDRDDQRVRRFALSTSGREELARRRAARVDAIADATRDWAEPEVSALAELLARFAAEADHVADERAIGSRR
jgi:DNA-binding MarR family transcriptional regulator